MYSMHNPLYTSELISHLGEYLAYVLSPPLTASAMNEELASFCPHCILSPIVIPTGTLDLK